MRREEKAAKMLMLFNINDIGEGELNTWYSGIDKDMQEALNIAIEVLQGQSTYCEECREATNDMLCKMQRKIKELKDTKESDLISRYGVSAWLSNIGYERLADMVMDKKRFPSMALEYESFCGVPIEEAVRIIQKYSVEPMVLTCDGCRHVGTYDTDFPCSGCIRREKDYYEQER